MSKFVRFVCDKCGADSNKTDRLEFHSVLLKSKPELTFYCHHDHYEVEKRFYLCDDCLKKLKKIYPAFLKIYPAFLYTLRILTQKVSKSVYKRIVG